jgi:hypothetical protein
MPVADATRRTEDKMGTGNLSKRRRFKRIALAAGITGTLAAAVAVGTVSSASATGLSFVQNPSATVPNGKVVLCVKSNYQGYMTLPQWGPFTSYLAGPFTGGKCLEYPVVRSDSIQVYGDYITSIHSFKVGGSHTVNSTEGLYLEADGTTTKPVLKWQLSHNGKLVRKS